MRGPMTNNANNHRAGGPSLIEAAAPVLTLAILMGLVIAAFGDDATGGPAQLALIAAGALAGLLAVLRGVDWELLETSVVSTVSSATIAILILLSIGALIGVWMLAGVIPTLVYYGTQILNPAIFYPSALILCAIVSLAIGSSWTTAGAIGVALMGIAEASGLSLVITAGAVISGAYFGDKLSPLSDTTNLAPAVAGSELFDHIRFMMWTTVPAFLIALVFFTVAAQFTGPPPEAGQVGGLIEALEGHFNITLWLLAPLFILLFLAQRRMPALPTLLISILVAAAFAAAFQWQGNAVFMIGEIWQVAAGGYEAQTGNVVADELLSRGGMGSMLTTIWLILSAMFFSGMMEGSGQLARLVTALTRGLQRAGAVIAGAGFTAMFANLIASDQYMSIVITGRMYADEFKRRKLAPVNLSRALEDFGTITSPLVPWNTCGAYMAATLGVATTAYLPFAIFNIAGPLVALAFAATHFKIRAAEEAHAS